MRVFRDDSPLYHDDIKLMNIPEDVWNDFEKFKDLYNKACKEVEKRLAITELETL